MHTNTLTPVCPSSHPSSILLPRVPGSYLGAGGLGGERLAEDQRRGVDGVR